MSIDDSMEPHKTMSDYVVSIPERLYEQARQLALQTHQTVDDLIRDRLAGAFNQPLIDIPTEERLELRALAYLSDDALWTVGREQMQPAKQDRLSHLMEKNSQGTITSEAYETLATLVEDGQRLTLRKAQAMSLLMDRGHQARLSDLGTLDG